MKIFIPLVFIFTLIASANAYAATMQVSPIDSNVKVGDRITIDVIVSTPDTSINAVSGTLLYKTNQLKPISISTQGKVNFWTKEPSFKNGEIEFEGIMMNPGYIGSRGQIFRAVFEARSTGKITFRLIDGAVLANDGLGTNVLSGFKEGAVTVTEAIPEAVIDVPKTEEPAKKSEEQKDKILPTITEYSASVSSKNRVLIKGKGEPHLLMCLAY